MLKQKKILYFIASITTITLASSVYIANTLLKSSNNAVDEIPFVERTSDSSLRINNGVFIETAITDVNGYDWILITNLNYDLKQFQIKTLTKAFAANTATATFYKSFLNTANNSIDAIAEGAFKTDSANVDIRLPPTQFIYENNKITLPELAIFLNINKSENPQTKSAVVAMLGSASLKSQIGATTQFLEPRIKVELGDEKSFSAKFNSISVGNIVIAKSPDIEVKMDRTSANLFNLNTNFNADFISDLNNIQLNSSLDNLSDKVAIDLSTNIFTTMAGISTQQDKTQTLLSLFNYAKQGGTGSIQIKASNKDNHPISITGTIKFDKNKREYIDPSNAFSVLDYAIISSNIDVPVSTAAQYSNPVWIERFLRDGIVKLKNGQIQSDIYIKNMNATINGKTFSL